MFDLWKEPLTEEERDRLIDKAANEISKRKLETPAVLLLEMHKPISYVGSHAAIAFAPFLIPILGFDTLNDYSRLFSNRDNLERLIQRLENRGGTVTNEEAPCTP